jgi:hypothetical protein
VSYGSINLISNSDPVTHIVIILPLIKCQLSSQQLVWGFA